MPVVLIVDDIEALAEQYAYDLERVAGVEARTAIGGQAAINAILESPIDCIILDLEMPDVDGFAVLRELGKSEIDTPVIVYTGTGDYTRCVQAVKLGAYSFIDKAEPMEQVAHEVKKALEHAEMAREITALRSQVSDDSSLIGSSEPMRALKAALARIGPIPSSVLVLGESGTGKELVAREIHRHFEGAHPDAANPTIPSSRSKPFVAINCAALPDNLVESELFGHERGAFTGASKTHRGAFERAAGGTIFLDEIGEMPIQVQAKLLRVLEAREMTRVGGEKPIKVSARIVAASNRDLSKSVESGTFRQDLLFRLNVHSVVVPPLRERRSDIPEIADLFLAQISRQFGIRRKRLAPDALEALMAYEWRRNNVRELRNIIERMVISTDDQLLGIDTLPLEVTEDFDASGRDAVTFRELKSEAERQIIVAALERNDWHITNTAAELGLADHASLLKIMRRHDVARRSGS